jgi:hypothetical protein
LIFRQATATLEIALPAVPGPCKLVAEVDAPSGRLIQSVRDLVVAALPEPERADRLSNLSARARVGAGERLLVAGFVVAGPDPKRVLLRGAGPSLAAHGIDEPLPDPVLTLFNDGTPIAESDDWDPTLAPEFARLGAFAWPEGSQEASLVLTLAPGAYTVHLSGAYGATGIALAEIYDAEPPP